jgi:hypothetical protein
MLGQLPYWESLIDSVNRGLLVAATPDADEWLWPIYRLWRDRGKRPDEAMALVLVSLDRVIAAPAPPPEQSS